MRRMARVSTNRSATGKRSCQQDRSFPDEYFVTDVRIKRADLPENAARTPQ